MRRRGGITFNEEGKPEYITCIVTGEMTDGTKVWTECDEKKNPVHIEKQYTLRTGGGLSEFVKL